MPIYVHAVGAHVKVHSYNATPPSARVEAKPPALVLLCHGFFSGAAGTIQVPQNLPEIRFAVEHGSPNDNIDAKYFQDLIKEGLNSALEFDFKYLAQPGGNVTNYYLGKGEPSLEKGNTPAEILSYDKDDRVSDGIYNAKKVGNVAVLSRSYVQNIMQFMPNKVAEAFDFASLKRSCSNLNDVFTSLATALNGLRYDYLLFAFCREYIHVD